jgi:hypothetical protein
MVFPCSARQVLKVAINGFLPDAALHK